MAAANGHVEVVKYLLSLLPKDEAEKLASRQNESGNTALHWAAYNGHLEVCQLLTQEYNVDVYIKNGSGHDAIYEAEANNQEEVENWLLKMFAIEDNVKVEEKGEDTKVTYTPGKESKELEEQAQEAVKKASEEKQQMEAVSESTEKLSIQKDESSLNSNWTLWRFFCNKARQFGPRWLSRGTPQMSSAIL